ncbi:MAG: hypothetical protein ACI8PT_002887 [Gammaproteobacteria bacterium]|jgi:hypothetical protein
MGIVIPLRRRATKRMHKRVTLMQPVALVDGFGTVATAQIADISPGGLQVLCERYTMDSLHLSDRPPKASRAVPIDVHFKLPLSSGLVKLDVECRLVYVVPEGDLGEFVMGLQFLRFHYAGAHIVERFLKEAAMLELS